MRRLSVNEDRVAYFRKPSHKNWYGIRGVEFIWHGTQADPELKYKGKIFNSHDIEDGLWNLYNEMCDEYDEKPSNAGFESWIKENPDYVYDELDDAIYGGYYRDDDEPLTFDVRNERLNRNRRIGRR